MSDIKLAYLLAGGRSSDPGSMSIPLSIALKECGKEKPKVAYIGTASGDNLIFFGMIKALLLKAGAGEVHMVKLAKAKINLEEAKSALENADVIFISGGEVEDGIRWLNQHGLMEFIKELRERGKVFIGVSAGSIMMGSRWVHWADPKDDSTASLFDCLGFTDTTFDTHAEDEGWRELILALKLQGKDARGYGIPIGGVITVDSQGEIKEIEKKLLCYVNDGNSVRKI